jgi:RNA polymerase sigma factor (sigma-70 family)
MTEDAELIRQYAATGSEEAFTELVRRHLPLVYSAALRQVRGDESLAKDVSQTVFIDLAKKAGSLTGRDLLAGWLYTSTRLAASNLLRANHRRTIREQRAIAMDERVEHTEPEETKTELKLVLDEAMSKLDSAERNAVLLRFFQGKDLKEVGMALGVSEDAARMRVNRSLGKLHTLLTKRGLTLSAAALGTALASETISAVPAGLVATVSETALASAAAATASTLTIAKVLTMTKLQIGIAGAIVVVGVATPLALQQKSNANLREQNQALQKRITELETATAASRQVADSQLRRGDTPQAAEDRSAELLRLRAEVAQLRHTARELEILKAAHSQLTNSPVVRKALDAEVRFAKLKQLMRDRPNLVIPEFYLLGEGDLRGAAKANDLETEDGIRAAFVSLRFRAENSFAANLQPALKAYTEAHSGQPPEKPEELAPYFDPPIDPSVLSRYAVVHFDPKLVKGGWAGGWVISQAEPVDEADMRWNISPVGFGPEKFESAKEDQSTAKRPF